MSRETKRPRITRPTENRDENRRSNTQNFGNREGGEREFKRPNRFNTDRSDREQGYGFIRDLNQEREREQSGDSDNGNRYRRETDGNRERGTREGNRFENRDNNSRGPRRSFDRDNRDNRDSRYNRDSQDNRYNRDRDNRDNRYNRNDNRDNRDNRNNDNRDNRYNRDNRDNREYRDNRDNRENYRDSDRGERRERRPQDGNRDNRFQDRNRNEYRRDDRRERENREDRGDRRERFTERPRRSFDGDGGAKSVYSKKKQIEFRKKNEDQETELRLNRFIAKGGICSRRDADVLITSGRVKVNGEVVQQVGVKVKRTDKVEVDEQMIVPERKVYIVLNKPKDYVTTVEDPLERKTVMSLIDGACKERVYPVGRLDRQTTGVLLFTNDGDLAKKLTHPKYNQKKIYHVFLDKVVNFGDLDAIRKGIELEDGFVQADDVQVAADDRTQVGIEIHSGRNRIVRRIFEHLGYQILRLDRVFFAGITKKNLPRGRWRFLTQDEINVLKAY